MGFVGGAGAAEGLHISSSLAEIVVDGLLPDPCFWEGFRYPILLHHGFASV